MRADYLTELVVRVDRRAWLLFAAFSLRGRRAALVSKEKKENEQTSNRESREEISEKVQHVMDY
jgi:hypothetical protein